MKKIMVVVAMVCLLSFVCANSFAQSMGSWNVFQQNGIQQYSRQNSSSGLLYSVGISRFFNSYASYQFDWPNIPTSPDSRIEYPIDQWFAGVGAQYNATNWALTAQYWFPISHDTQVRFQDSDWGEIIGIPFNVSGKTVFIEMDSKLKGAGLFDVGVQGPAVPQISFLIPVFGYRYQSFSFESSDGFIKSQISRPIWNRDLPGVNFEQTTRYEHLYLGGLLDLPAISVGRTSTFRLVLQADGAWVKAHMSEYRPWGNTYMQIDNATGWCYHLAGNCKYVMLGTVNLDFGIDFKRIDTYNGEWDLVTNNRFGYPARMYSDQLSLTGSVGYLF